MRPARTIARLRPPVPQSHNPRPRAAQAPTPTPRISNAIIVVNAGSSSVKFSLYGDEADDLVLFLTGQIEGIDTATTHFIAHEVPGHVLVDEHTWAEGGLDHDQAMTFLLDFIEHHLGGHEVEAVGHRIVHGGPDFSGPVRLDAATLDRLDRLVPLAPLHQPHNLAPARSMMTLAPELVQVGCFDTAFHATQTPQAKAYALPPEITERGIRRYGFHGLSYEYITSVLPDLDPGLAQGRVIICHLGNGASMCAVNAGRSVASTMGFTAVEGLPMGTRCGTLDPGVLLYLMDQMKYDARDIERLIYKQSGLLGVSGVSSDMRVLENSTDPRAKEAIDLFIYRIGREMGSLAAALGGLDGLVFTAGIGEHSAATRRGACAAAAWLGVTLDDAANEAGATRISTPDSRVSAWVVPTNEQLMIARQTRRLLG